MLDLPNNRISAGYICNYLLNQNFTSVNYWGLERSAESVLNLEVNKEATPSPNSNFQKHPPNCLRLFLFLFIFFVYASLNWTTLLEHLGKDFREPYFVKGSFDVKSTWESYRKKKIDFGISFIINYFIIKSMQVRTNFLHKPSIRERHVSARGS